MTRPESAGALLDQLVRELRPLAPDLADSLELLVHALLDQPVPKGAMVNNDGSSTRGRWFELAQRRLRERSGEYISEPDDDPRIQRAVDTFNARLNRVRELQRAAAERSLTDVERRELNHLWAVLDGSKTLYRGGRP